MPWTKTGNIRGPQGIQGIQGIQGPQGIQGVNSYTTLTADITIPAVGAYVFATVADASWITIGQMLYVATAGTNQQAAVLQVTGKTGNTLTLFNPPPGAGVVGGVADAPTDGHIYGRKNGTWVIIG